MLYLLILMLKDKDIATPINDFFKAQRPYQSSISSFASFLSFAVLLPLLLWQSWTDKKMLEHMNVYMISHLGELRPLNSSQEGLDDLNKWIKDPDARTKNLLYVSKLSAVPGFWIMGNRWIIDILNDYTIQTGKNFNLCRPSTRLPAI